MGRDLSAQLAHAQLAESHWPALLDLRWYGGFDPLGYSVLSPPVMALLGVRLTTALAYVASVVLFAALLKSTAVPRPVAGAIVAAVCLTGNLVVTRTTFALGLALGLGALLAFASGRVRVAVGAVCPSGAQQPGGWFVPRRSWRCAFPVRPATRRRDAGCQLPWCRPSPSGWRLATAGTKRSGSGQALMGFLVCLVVAGLCLAPSGCPLGWAVVGRAGRCGLSAADAGGYDCDTSARVVRRADYRGGRGRPSGGRHCRRRKRGLAVAAGIDHRGARSGAIPH